MQYFGHIGHPVRAACARMHVLNLVNPYPRGNFPKHLKLPFCELSDKTKRPSK